MTLARYVLRRLGLLAVTLFLISLAISGIMQLLPGDAAEQVADPDHGIVAVPDVRWPLAETIARLAYARFAAGERHDALRLCPVYFHLNEAEEKRRKRGMKVG